MIAETGHYALVLALGLALIQGIVPIVGVRMRDGVLAATAQPLALAQLGFVAVSFAALTACYVASDFSVFNVFENSHSAMPLVYKFTSVWGNHEGSMLLWVLILSVFGALVAPCGRNLPASCAPTCSRFRPGSRQRSIFYSCQFQPVPAPRQCAGRGARPQPAIAGYRARDTPAVSLSRLCRLLDLLFVCDRGPDRRPHRRGVGALMCGRGSSRPGFS
jgi:hypothetical protein